MQKFKFGALLIAAIAIPVIGYGVMYGITYLFSMSEDTIASHLVYTLMLIALGLIIPYWMLKAGIGAASMMGQREDGMHLSDIGKDSDELVHHDSQAHSH